MDRSSEHADFHAELLRECGLLPFAGTRYYVLARNPAVMVMPPSSLRSERLPEGAEPILGCYGDGEARERYRSTIGKEGFDHFVARYEGKVVSTARLFHWENLSYFVTEARKKSFGAEVVRVRSLLNESSVRSIWGLPGVSWRLWPFRTLP